MKDNDNELFAEVDEEGNIIGKMTRWEAHNGATPCCGMAGCPPVMGKKRLHAVVHLHLFNSKGELYMQHRPSWKDIQPDKWDTACGGHVDYGESIEVALKREVREELGIADISGVEFIGKYVFESKRERELVYVHKLVYDGEVKPSENELNGGRFFSLQEIADKMGKEFFTPNFESEYSKFFL